MIAGLVNWTRVLAYFGALMALFVLGAVKTNIYVSAFVTACFALGYFNDFILLRTLISAFRGPSSDAIKLAFAVGILAGDAMVVYSGFGLVLALTTACCIFIDAVILRLK